MGGSVTAKANADRRTSFGGWLGRAVLVAAVMQSLRIGLQIRRELAAFKASQAELGTSWSTVPSITRKRQLRVHARTHARSCGRGPTMVLLHGYAIGSTYLVPLAARLSREARVYAPDLPGHGLSEHDVRPLTIPELARALEAFMDSQGLRAALVIGHSMGSQIAVELARNRPDLTAGLLLVGPTCDSAAPTPIQQILRGALTGFFERPSFYVWALIDYGRAGLRLLLHELRELTAHRIDHVLPGINIPVRVVRGAHDYIAPQRWALTVAHLGKTAPPKVLPRWGHCVQYSEPERIARIALDFASELDGAAAPRSPGASA